MGLFRKSPPKANPTEVAALQSQLDALLRRMETAEVDQTHLGARVVALDDITADLAQRHLDKLATLDERLTETNAGAAETAARLAALDERLTNVSTELANQIAELGGEIDAVAGSPSTVGDEHANGSVERIDALLTGQTKLASEQARYEIAFRADLAALAEQIRRSSGR